MSEPVTKLIAASSLGTELDLQTAIAKALWGFWQYRDEHKGDCRVMACAVLDVLRERGVVR